MIKIFIIDKLTRETFHLFVNEELEFNEVYLMINTDKYEVEHIEVKDKIFIGVNNKDDANYLDLPWS